MQDPDLKSYRNLRAWQTGLMLFAGGLLGLGVTGHPNWLADFIDLEIQNLMLLALTALIVAVAYFGTIVCHELYEINDQLAGRSSEFKKWLAETANKNGKGN